MKKIKKLSSDSEIDFENVNKIIDAVNELQEIVSKDVKKVVNGKYKIEELGHWECLEGCKQKSIIGVSEALSSHPKGYGRHRVGGTDLFHICKVEDKPDGPKEALTLDWDKPETEEPIDVIATLKHVKLHLIGYQDAESTYDIRRVIEYLEGIEERKREAIKLLDSRKWSLTTLEKAIKAI